MSKITCEQCATDDPDADIRLGVCTPCNTKQGGMPRLSLTEMPTSFESPEQMNKYVQHLQEYKARQATTVEAVKEVPQKSRNDVYQVVGFFVRPGDSWASIKRDAKDEKELRNTNVLVWAHNHQFQEACSKKCHEIMTPEGDTNE